MVGRCLSSFMLYGVCWFLVWIFVSSDFRFSHHSSLIDWRGLVGRVSRRRMSDGHDTS